MLAVAGVTADCDGVADFGRDRLEWLRQFLPFENGVPSNDTLARVFSIIDVEQLEECVARWGEQTFLLSTEASFETVPSDAASAANRDTATTPRPHVAFDGKTMRGSHDGSPLHVVTAYASTPGVSLGQTAVAEKSNEITAIPLLVNALCLAGCVVTIDAMRAQKEIARCLRDEFSLSQTEIAIVTGKSKAEISKFLALHDKVVPEVQKLARGDSGSQLSRRHLYSLSRIAPEEQPELADRIVRENLTADRTEQLTRAASHKEKPTVRKRRGIQQRKRQFKTSKADVLITFHKQSMALQQNLWVISGVKCIRCPELLSICWWFSSSWSSSWLP